MNIRKTIYVSSSYDSKYLRYDVRLLFTNTGNSIRVYRGKTLVMGGKTTVDLSNVLKDYKVRDGFVYDEATFGYKPTRVYNVPTESVQNIESTNNIANICIEIKLYEDNENSVLVATDSVTVNCFCREIPDPYLGTGNGLEDYNNGVLINHIPYLLTNNYWLGLCYAITNNGSSNVVGVLSDRNGGGFKLSTQTQLGNYVYNIPLKTLFNGLVEEGGNSNVTVYIGSSTTDRLIGGSATVVAEGITGVVGADLERYEGLYGKDKLYLDVQVGKNIIEAKKPMVVIDECPKEWYVAWLDCNGWHSEGLVHALEVVESDKRTVINIYNERTVVHNNKVKRWQCKSMKVNKEEYEVYKNIVMADYVWLYNSKTDTCYCCTVEDNSVGYSTERFCTWELREIKG